MINRAPEAGRTEFPDDVRTTTVIDRQAETL